MIACSVRVIKVSMETLNSKLFPPVKCIIVTPGPFCSKKVMLFMIINWFPAFKVLIDAIQIVLKFKEGYY